MSGPAREEPVGVGALDSPLRAMAGYNMKRAFNAIRQDLNVTLAPFELRMVSFSVLMLIVNNPGIRQSHIAQSLSIERPNLVAVVDDLETRGLVQRNAVPTDRRAHALKATLAGRRLCERAVAAVARHERNMMAGLSQRDQAALFAALLKIERNLTAGEPGESRAAGRS